MKYYLIAGEASGDLHASNLMKSLKNTDPNPEFRFFGGDLMSEQGGTLVKHYKEMAFMGIIPVLMNLLTILKNMKLCKMDIEQYKPDVVILVDYPGFNLKIAKFVKEKLRIPVYYYISPKIWAWKQYRIKEIKQYINKMYCILPFEVDFYQNQQFPVTYVGNPSVDAISHREYKDETFEAFTMINNLSSKPIIALLAGSRKQEIANNLPTMLRCASKFSEYQIVIAGAPGIDPNYYNTYLSDAENVKIVFNQTFRLLQQSYAALVTSGTATLETALLRVPQVVCYYVRGKKIVNYIFDHFFHIKYISLVNLIAAKAVVKELFGSNFSEESITTELDKLLNNSIYRTTMFENYQTVINKIGETGASQQTANLIYKSLND